MINKSEKLKKLMREREGWVRALAEAGTGKPCAEAAEVADEALKALEGSGGEAGEEDALERVEGTAAATAPPPASLAQTGPYSAPLRMRTLADYRADAAKAPAAVPVVAATTATADAVAAPLTVMLGVPGSGGGAARAAKRSRVMMLDAKEAERLGEKRQPPKSAEDEEGGTAA